MTYGLQERIQFLRGKGIITARYLVAKKNITSQRVLARFNPRIYAEARYLRILWWKSWEEKALPG